MTAKTQNSQRIATFLVALLQLAILPATHLLHIGCGCAHSSEVHDGAKSCPFGHCCSCGHHSADRGTEQDSPSEPHDSDSCAVCKAAFAVTTVEFDLPPLLFLAETGRLQCPSCIAPELSAPYRLLSRGPPAA